MSESIERNLVESRKSKTLQRCKVVNIKDFESFEDLQQKVDGTAHYIGRPNKHYGLKGSALANPFKLREGEPRGTTLARYRKYLWNLMHDPIKGKAINHLLYGLHKRQSVLVCYCSPEPCHGDIVAAAAEYVYKLKNHKVI